MHLHARQHWSTSCCPHGCLYPVAARSSPLQAAQYRLSVVVTWLLARTGNPLSPAFYMMACSAVTLLTVLTLREVRETH